MTRHLDPRAPTDGLTDEGSREYFAWLKAKCGDVTELCTEFPIGTVISDPAGDDWYVVGWQQAGVAVLVCPQWPPNDRTAAFPLIRQWHINHLREPSAQVRRFKPS